MSPQTSKTDPKTAMANFAKVIAPITPEEFFRDYYGKKHLHIPGKKKKFDNVMNWNLLDDLLNMNDIWTNNNLMLAKDHQVYPPQAYCQPGVGRDNAQVMKPVTEKVMAEIENGASIVLNSVESLQPGLRRMADYIEYGVGAKVQMNLYCSRKSRQAFAPHPDVHDVFAIHVEGEKLWNIYDVMADNPISHPMFNQNPNMKNPPIREKVLMKPGDFLYIPRGLFHDALSQTEGCIHIAISATYPIGLDLVTQLYDIAMQDSFFRQNLPTRQSGATEEDMQAYLAEMSEKLSSVVRDERFSQAVKWFQDNYHFARGGYNIRQTHKK